MPGEADASALVAGSAAVLQSLAPADDFAKPLYAPLRAYPATLGAITLGRRR